MCRCCEKLLTFAFLFIFSITMLSARDFSSQELRKCSPQLRLLLKKAPIQLSGYQNRYGVNARNDTITYDVLFKFKPSFAPLDAPGLQIQAIVGTIATARTTRSGLVYLAGLPNVEWIEVAKYLEPALDVSRISTEVDQVYSGNPSYRGNGVLVAIFDSGIDWRHEDFIDNFGNSRILYLWDMTDDGGPHPVGFDYGTEYTREQINDEIDGSPTGRVREKDINGHGTHVAGIAAGDGSATGQGYTGKKYIGIAPQADLIIVKGGDSGYSTSNQVNGTHYVMKKARQLGRPVVINFSLGGHGGAHDGTELHEQAIDAAVGPGRAIVVAASNDGGSPLHASGVIYQGGSVTVGFTVLDQNDYFWIDLWHDGSDIMSLSVKTPDGDETPTRASGTENDGIYWDTSCGRIELVAASPNPNNQDYNFFLYVNDEGGTAVKAGDWSFTVTGTQVRNGRFDAWTQPWRVEFTSQVDYTMLVGMPGTARQAITVASYCTKKSWLALDGSTYSYNSNPNLWDISDFSSPGPTRDGRYKPEITAPGHGIAAALSKDSTPDASKIVEDGVHVIMQGTSMAAPHVAGAVALLLQKDPTLNPAQIKEILINSAWTDVYTGTVWNNAWGWGKLNINAALQRVQGSVAGTTAQHDIGSVNCGLSDWGALGRASGASPGFLFPLTSDYDHGYSGTLVAAVWDQDVADSYGNLDESEDDTWRTTATGQFRLSSPGRLSDQDGYAQFEKGLSTPDGLTWVQVTQHSYAWSDAPYNQFVLIDYEIKNQGPFPLQSLQLGYYMDWDCQPDFETNEARYDADLKIAYMWDSGSTGTAFLGTQVLGQNPTAVKFVRNAESVYQTSDLPDPVLFELMNTPGIMTSMGQGDLSTLMTISKINLQPNQSSHFTIALVAGTNLANLRQTGARAREKYLSIQGQQLSELFYDDGTPEGGINMTVAGERLAVRFTPLTYPAVLRSASFYARTANANVRLNVYDDNGTNGRPGTALLTSPLTITPQAQAWNTVNLSGQAIRIPSGDFYIALEWLVPGDPSIGYDDEFPHAGRSWSYDKTTLNWSNFLDDGPPWNQRDLMIGAGLERTTFVDRSDESFVPAEFSLFQNYPNPFNASTVISFTLPKRTRVTLKIYDILGQEVAVLVQEAMNAGQYPIQFTASGLASGIYFYQLQAEKFCESRKMVVIR